MTDDADRLDLTGARVGFLVANEGVERVELEQPWEAVERLGATAILIAPEAGTVQTFDHLEKAATKQATATVGEVSPEDLDALVLPGGVANPDQLRMRPEAVDFVRRCMRRGMPVAAICHAPWTLVEADEVRGRTLTSWPSLQTDIGNAGGHWVDEPLVIDDGGPSTLITSRNPDDLPVFCEAIAARFALARAH